MVVYLLLNFILIYNFSYVQAVDTKESKNTLQQHIHCQVHSYPGRRIPSSNTFIDRYIHTQVEEYPPATHSSPGTFIPR